MNKQNEIKDRLNKALDGFFQSVLKEAKYKATPVDEIHEPVPCILDQIWDLEEARSMVSGVSGMLDNGSLSEHCRDDLASLVAFLDKRREAIRNELSEVPAEYLPGGAK